MQRKMSTKERLMSSFLELLEERSIQDISVADIYTNAGVSKRSIYNHFSDKFDLMGNAYRILVEQQWYKDGRRCTLEEF